MIGILQYILGVNNHEKGIELLASCKGDLKSCKEELKKIKGLKEFQKKFDETVKSI